MLLEAPPNVAVFVTVPGTQADPVGTVAWTCSVTVAPAGSVNVPEVAGLGPQLSTCGVAVDSAQLIAVPLGVTVLVFSVHVYPVGSVSFNASLVASPVPVLLKVTVNPMVPPAFTVSASAVLVPATFGHVTVTAADAFG